MWLLSLVILLDINMISFHGLQNRVSFEKQLKGSLLFHLGIIPVFWSCGGVSYSAKWIDGSAKVHITGAVYIGSILVMT